MSTQCRHCQQKLDALTFGGADPNSGSAGMLEVLRCFTELLSTGWRPRRSIWFHSWDGEEHNLLGSTGYGEHFASELQDKAITYLNLDVGASGPFFGVAASPSLITMIEEVLNMVPYPGTNRTVLDHWTEHAGRQVGILGSGSDFTVFLDRLGIPCISHGFSNSGIRGTSYGAYHSAYDNINYMEKVADPGFLFQETSAKILGAMALRLSEDEHYPLNFIVYAGNLETYYDTLVDLLDGDNTTEVNLTPLFDAIGEFKLSAVNLDEEIGEFIEFGWPDSKTRLEINQRMQDSERAFLNPAGLPGRPWYKHTVQAPGLFLGYGAQVFPGITQAILEEDWEVANEQILQTSALIREASQLLKPAEIDNLVNFIILYIVIGVASVCAIGAIIKIIIWCRQPSYQQV